MKTKQQRERGNLSDILHNAVQTYTGIGKIVGDALISFGALGPSQSSLNDLNSCRKTKYGLLGSTIGILGVLGTIGFIGYGISQTVSMATQPDNRVRTEHYENGKLIYATYSYPETNQTSNASTNSTNSALELEVDKK